MVMLCGDIIDEYTSKEEKEEVFEALGKLSNTTKCILCLWKSRFKKILV